LLQRPIKVLLVDADQNFYAQLTDELGDGVAAGVELEWAGELSEALARLTRGGFDALLLSLDLPDSHGMVTFDRAFAFNPDTPIIALVDRADEVLVTSTVQAGAQDCLVRDEVTTPLVLRSLRHAVERHRLFRALRDLSLIDDLTQLYNRRGFQDLGQQYLKLARRTGRGVTVVYVDLDRFKTINDSLGHLAGDRALIKMAEILRASFRRSDIIARLGGDEFGVLALEASDETSEGLVARLRERVREFNASSTEPYQLAISVGMARIEDDPSVRLDDLVASADSAMYREKHEKRAATMRGR